LIDEQHRLAGINGFSIAGMVFFAGSAVAAVLVTAGTEVAALQVSPPNLVMLLLFSAAIFESVGQLPPALNLFPAVRESSARIFELSDAPIPVPDAALITSMPVDNAIRFTNVSASYLAGSGVLHDFSLTVPPGGSVVLTGGSGAGKSLLLEVLLRFRNYQGSVTVGGAEITALPKESLLKLIAAVPQRPHLFNGSIRDNILLGNPSASDELLRSAVYDSCLESWIDGLPDGLDTQVGLNGSAVSGGEGRRIALARALVKNAPILLLDEPTESLDLQTDLELVSRLKQRFRNLPGCTIMVVSHRPACLFLGDLTIRITSVPCNIP
ncbi:MAG: ATP-binding cassette domain-containing protein, partial [Desulfuromonadaceae bacterium]|nr:ATP-binding cassette domain-containing protein [Desulfuromonadaceae bacterium]